MPCHLFGIHQISGPRQLLLLARATHVAGEHASGTEWKETMAELASYVKKSSIMMYYDIEYWYTIQAPTQYGWP